MPKPQVIRLVRWQVVGYSAQATQINETAVYEENMILLCKHCSHTLVKIHLSEIIKNVIGISERGVSLELRENRSTGAIALFLIEKDIHEGEHCYPLSQIIPAMSRIKMEASKIEFNSFIFHNSGRIRRCCAKQTKSHPILKTLV